jgi:hypothetical protein
VHPARRDPRRRFHHSPLGGPLAGTGPPRPPRHTAGRESLARTRGA